MARAVSEIETEIRVLEPNDEEQLLRALLKQLDGPADPDFDRTWLEEAYRRSLELDSGAVEAISPDRDSVFPVERTSTCGVAARRRASEVWFGALRFGLITG
jgi:hypothetical protein